MNARIRSAQLALRSPAPAPPPAPHRELAEEQVVYARLLDRGMKSGILFLVATVGIYLFGVLPPHVPVEELPRYWSLPVNQYLAATGVHAGWSWLGMLHKGDFLNFLGIALLSGVTIGCYLAICPIFFRKGDRIFGCIAALEVLVLTLAASGMLGAGGH